MPWLSEPLHGLGLLWRVINFVHSYRREGDSVPPTLHVRAYSHIYAYAAFPHLQTIGKTAECSIFKEWHDQVMLPAFKEVLKIAGRASPVERPPTHQLAVMNSEAEGVEMMGDYAPARANQHPG